MQQTARDFEFSSPSYARFSKMCLTGRGALDMSSGASRHVEIPSGRIKIFVLGRGVLDMSSGASRHVERDLADLSLTLFSLLNHL